jgi:hypothetical protein
MEGTVVIGIFDGHNDCVQRLQEYCPEGVDFTLAAHRRAEFWTSGTEVTGELGERLRER